jgi:hypothetical protein
MAYKEKVMTRKDVSSLVIVVLVGLVLQVGLIFLDCTNSPSDTAVNFIKAYYKLSPDMSKWLCNSAAGSSCPKAAEATCPNKSATCGNSMAADHIYNATSEAAEGGFGKGYARYTLSHIKTHTKWLDDTYTTAEVHLTAHSRRAINPLYVWVARLFSIGEPHEVDHTIQVKQINGRWLVCQSASLPETS